MLSPKIRNKARMYTVSTHFPYSTGVPQECTKERRIKGIKIGKEES